LNRRGRTAGWLGPTSLALPLILSLGACAQTESGGSEPTGPGTTAPIQVAEPVTIPPAAVPTLSLESITDALEEPVALALRPGEDAIYVAERLGHVTRVDPQTGAREPVLDLTDVVYGPISEQGLLGLTFDTDGRRLFVLYTDAEGDVQVVAYHYGDDGVDTESSTPILTVEEPHQYHQAGNMVFGPDGYLWISLGDGGGTGDPSGNAQNPSTLLGSIIRLDVDAAVPYAIPPDNPFATGEDGAEEVWAYGLRNPWRFTFDAGFVYIADVGQYEREEIDVIPLHAGGANFGWPIREGDVCYEATTCTSDGFVDPTVAIPHERLCATVGGPVYRGLAIPELTGQYFYGDYCVGWIRSLLFDGNEVIAENDWEAELGTPGFITTFGVDDNGEILVATQEGGLYRIVADA
jgi:glucose/arabinose dehydrogenase